MRKRDIEHAKQLAWDHARHLAGGDRVAARAVFDTAIRDVLWRRVAALTLGGEAKLWEMVAEELTR